MATRRTPAEKALDEAAKLTREIEAMEERRDNLSPARDRLLLFAYEESDGEITYDVLAERCALDRSRINQLLRRAREDRGD